MRISSNLGSSRELRWLRHWPIGLSLLVGLVLGILVQSTFHDGIHAFAKAAGFSKPAVHLALVFGPLLLALPFAYLLRAQATRLLALAAASFGFWLGGFVWLTFK